MSDQREALTKKLAELEAERRQIEQTKKRVHERAKKQWDTMPDAIDKVEKAAAGPKGSALTQRYLRTLHTERARLGQVVQDLEPDADDGDT